MNLPDPAIQPPRRRTGGTLGTALALLTALALGLLWGMAWTASVWGPLATAVLTVLPLLAVALVIWSFLLWTALPDHPAGAWLLGLSVLGPLVQWGPAYPARPTATGAGSELVVATWNVRRLWGGTAEGDVTTCVVDSLDSFGADVILLQEVSRKELASLAVPLGLDCAHGTYRASDGPDAAGLAVCSAGPRWRRGTGGIASYADTTDWQYVQTRVTDGRHEVDVLGVHLQPYRILHDPWGALPEVTRRLPATARSQLDQIAALRSRALANTIVGGDFNGTRDTPQHAQLRRSLDDTYERGAQGFGPTVHLLDRIPVRIDYVYATRDLGVERAYIPDVGCSDHRPIVTVLRVGGVEGGRSGSP